MILIISIKGIANKKIIPKAINFLVFPIQLKIAAIIHRKTMDTAAITTPTENISFTFIRLLNKNRYGIIKTLNDIKLTTIPFWPSMILGKEITHAKTMELTGISDHVKWPDIRSEEHTSELQSPS